TVTPDGASVDTPTAVNDTATTAEDTPTTITVLANDNFGGDGPSTTVDVVIATQGANGVATVNTQGTADSSDDTITYTPVNFNGIDTFTYTITDSNGDVSTAIVTVTVNCNTVSTPTVSAVVQPNCSVPTGSVNLTGLPSGNWVINPGNISGSTTSAVISNLAPGNYSFNVTNNNGCVSLSTGLITINSPQTVPAAPTVVVTLQPTCTDPTGTIVVTSPPGNTGFEYSVNGGTYQASTTFSGFLTSGVHIVTVRRLSDPTCVSPGTSVTLNAQPTAPAAPTVSVVSQPTCANSTGTVVVTNPPVGTGFEYSADGVNYQVSNVFSGTLTTGTYLITTRRISDATCISAGTSVTINAQPT
ncbi:Ig-like domain-containing protein, partial [Flavobacterium sp.]|uniref:Ig-like domain-containing protein n=1 Tax=Flavobacterium sp. TaxID=239 RepID=UPI003B9A738B